MKNPVNTFFFLLSPPRILLNAISGFGQKKIAVLLAAFIYLFTIDSTVAQTVSFNTPGAYTYTVAPGVTSIQVSAAGAKGNGGNGGNVTCNLSVYEGEILNLYVGGAGGGAGSYMSAGAGGYNGGGDGGTAYGSGGGGGGASDIRVGGTDLTNRIIVAGGGGGSGVYGTYYCSGGNGGGLTGSNGLNSSFVFDANYCGTGGTQTAGGDFAIYGESIYGSGATSGSLGQGGTGGQVGGWGGGGGGGGYYGGGGGGGCGGGGGSSYYGGAGVTSATTTAGANAGNGYITITVLCTVNIGTISGASSLCPGTSTGLSESASAGTWSSGTPDVASVNSSGAVTGVSAGTTVISYTVTDGCGTSSATSVVTVNAFATAGTITGTGTLCAGATTNLSDAAAGGSWSATGHASVDGSGNVMGVTAGTATISYTVTNSCNTANATTIVTVNPLADAGAITGTAIVCAGSIIHLTDAAAGGVWSATGHASVDGSGNVTGSTAGTATISYTATNSCGAVIAVQIVTVNALPAAGAITGPGTLCTGASIALTDAASGGSWSTDGSGHASVDASGNVTAITAGTTTISYTVTTLSCGSATASKTVTVNTTPGAGTISGVLSVCEGIVTSLTDLATGGSWSSGSGHASVDASGNVTGITAGTTTIQYAVTVPGCTVTASATVTVNAAPDAGTISGTLSVCTGATTHLADAAPGGSWSADGSGHAGVDGSGNVTGITAGTTAISYTASTPYCGSATASATITVNTMPAAITGTGNVCTGLSTSLTDAVAGGMWSVDASGHATVSGGIVTGVSAGTASVSYTTGPACYNTIVVTINQSPAGITGAGALCAGATLTLNATSASEGTPTVFNITGAPQIYTVPAGVYEVNVTLTGGQGGAGTLTSGGQGGTTMATIAVTPGQVLNVFVGDGGSNHDGSGGTSYNGGGLRGSVYGTGAGGGASDIRIGGTALSNRVIVAGGGGGGGFEESLNGGAGGGLIGMSGGFYPGTTAATGGTQTAGGAGEIPPSSFPYGISGNNGSLGQGGNMLAGAGGGAGGGGYYGGGSGDNYDEGGGAGGSSYADPAATSDVIMTQGTNTSYTGMVTITPLVTSAGVWASSSSNATVAGSTGVVTGVTAGTATVSFTVADGCSSTTVVTVNPLPDVGTITGAATACAGSTIHLSDAAGGGNWSSDSPAIGSVDASGNVTGIAQGTATISYTATNSCGTAAATTIVTVNLLPDAGTITGTAAVCAGASASLTDAAPGGVWSSSSNASVDASGNVTGISAGTATISYTVTNSCGTASTTSVATINATTAGTITGASAVVVGANITLTDAAGSGTWSASNGNATVSGGVVHGVNVGTVTILYSVTGVCGTASATKLVSVGAPTTTVTVSAISGYFFYLCTGANATFWDATTGGTWSMSPAGVATVSATGIVSGISTGTATLTYTYLSTQATAVVTVYATPATITGANGICIGATTALTDVTPGGTWSSVPSGIASINATGTVTGVMAGTATIYYTTPTAGCRAAQVVTVTTAPSGIGGAGSVCTGSSVTLSDFTTGGAWTSSAGVSVTTGTTVTTVTGISAGTSTVTYSLGTGCYKTFNVTVKALPSSILGNLSVCGVGAVTFLSDATAGTSWTISPVGTATISPSGRVYGVSAGTATVTYNATTGCNTTVIVTVNSLVTVSPISGATNVGHGLTITLSDATGGGVWTSSNAALGSVDAIGDVTGVGTSGTVTITYAVPYGSGCFATATKPITIHTPAPHDHQATNTNDVAASVSSVGISSELAGGDETTVVEEVNSIAAAFDVRLVPNPNNGVFTVTGTTGSVKDEAVVMEVTNMAGQIVYRRKVTATAGLINEQLVLGKDLANGMYLLNISSGSTHKVLHFVVEK